MAMRPPIANVRRGSQTFALEFDGRIGIAT
jgi:hypothetical protein